MRFEETRLKGAFLVEVEPQQDERGMFARSFCAREFAEHGLNERFVQCNVSRNTKCGTLRGLHYQKPPFEETKLVRCTRGRVFDVIVDLRRQSTTYREWFGVELGEQDCRALYIPPGFAHGFQTLVEQADVFYQMSNYYDPGSAAGVRWDDPAFAIDWPLLAPILSSRDASYVNVRS